LDRAESAASRAAAGFVGKRLYPGVMSAYCDFAPGHPVHGPYHDLEYGFPLRGEAELFERLVLEINQAGLSWETILKKREGFRRAYHGFEVDAVAAYAERDRARLLEDPGIIRNRLKIEAAIHNAEVVRRMRDSHGGFAQWLDAHASLDGRPRDKAAWVGLFKKTFRFTGGEIVGEFLMSAGYLPGAHREDCPVFQRIAECDPMWMRLRG
jgi:DNA-3-methyladenine glycosylase I